METINSQMLILKKYQQENRLTTQEIADKLDISSSLLYKLYNGERIPQDDVVKKIGDLIEKDNPHANNDLQEEKAVYKYKSVEAIEKSGKVPYYDIDVTAGNVQLFQDNTQMPTDYYTVPKEIQDVDFCFKVRGDSMYDKILPGAIVFVKQIMDISIIEFGQVFIIITEEQRMVKYVRRHPTRPDDMVVLRSHNNNYDDIDLPKEKITNLLLVKGYLNNYVL
jgi:phage repressor protein C with HTH and peptisase S24 domain